MDHFNHSDLSPSRAEADQGTRTEMSAAVRESSPPGGPLLNPQNSAATALGQTIETVANNLPVYNQEPPVYDSVHANGPHSSKDVTDQNLNNLPDEGNPPSDSLQAISGSPPNEYQLEIPEDDLIYEVTVPPGRGPRIGRMPHENMSPRED